MVAILAATEADLGDVRQLLARYAEGLAIDLGFQDFPAELADLPYPYVPPGGLLLVAKQGRSVLGLGAYKRITPAIAEIKRLYVLPAAQGRGIGRSLLVALMSAAAGAGYRALRLDTHRPSMAPALALYNSLGFAEIPPYGPDLGGQLAFFEAVPPPEVPRHSGGVPA